MKPCISEYSVFFTKENNQRTIRFLKHPLFIKQVSIDDNNFFITTKNTTSSKTIVTYIFNKYGWKPIEIEKKITYRLHFNVNEYTDLFTNYLCKDMITDHNRCIVQFS